MITKTLLRKEYLKKRNQLTKHQYSNFNSLLCEHFFELVDISAINFIHIYLPVQNKFEPNTWLIINRLRIEFPHIQILVPRIKKPNGLENVVFEGLHQLRLNAWNIYEPTFGNVVDSENIQVAVVPLLAFDERGNRVGYGKGFYDRLLSSCRSDCKKIGLSFFTPEKRIYDVNENDVILDLVITPNKAFHF